MSTMTAILQAAFDWTWRTSLQTSILIVLVLLLQRLLGRWLTPRLRYALSILALCRLLLPVAPASSFSLENLFASTHQPVPSRPPPTPAAASNSETATLVPAPGLTLGATLCVTWFCGLVVLGGLAAWRYCHWRRTIRNAREVLDPRLLKLLADVRHEAAVHRPVSLASVHNLGSPAVFGFWRFHLLLPQASLNFLSLQEWRMVFLHEMTHIRNRDTILNAILIPVQFFHWFNPLVWIALQRLRTDRELVCDALVVERLKTGERLAYAQVLLRLAETISDAPRAFPSAVPVVSRVSEIKTRLALIKNYRRSGRTLRAAVGVSVLLLGLLTFTRAREDDVQTANDSLAKPLSASARTQRDVEDQILNEFKTAGYSLPESMLDDKVQETIRNEFGNRANFAQFLKDRGMTSEKFRQHVKEQITATNGPVAPYGSSTMGLGTNQGPLQPKVAAIDIRYTGSESVKKTDVLPRIRTQLGKPFNTVDIDDDIRNLYATGLFHNISVATEFSPNGVRLVYNLQCNPGIAKLLFTGNRQLSDTQLQKLIRSKVGGVFNERNTFSDAQAIEKAYETAGVKDTQVKYSYDIDQQTGKASVTFKITEKN
jgi:beta-lactamase regulating signal transducer with metallopeptidase domain